MQQADFPPLLTRNTSDRPANFTLAGILEIPFYGREFHVVMRTCRNAICDCGTLELYLYMPDRLGTNDFSFRIHGDALEHRLDLDDSAENSGYAARMLDLYLTAADWVSIEGEWRLSKAMLIEHLNPHRLDFSVKFPADFRRDSAKLMPFSRVFALRYPYRATFREKEFELIDSYCINSHCPCTDAMFSFFTPEEDFFAFWYNYRDHGIKIPPESKGKISIAEATQVVEQLNARYPNFTQFIENRNRVLRALYAADMKNRPTSKPMLTSTSPRMPFPRLTGVVGRNDPCPCGSGKKYKRCCGK